MDKQGQPFNLAPGEGRSLPTPAGGHVTLKVRGAESSGRVSVLEFELPPGAGPRPHVHEETEECIYVLRGELRVHVGDEVHDAAVGSCVFIPRGLQHHFKNMGESRALVLGVFTPAGIENFFEGFAEGVSDDQVSP